MQIYLKKLFLKDNYIKMPTLFETDSMITIVLSLMITFLI